MINSKLIKEFDSKLTAQDRAVSGAIAKFGINETSLNNDILRKHTHKFSTKTLRGERTSQNKSGRCWMFAALNTARVDAMKNLNIETFEFSENYTLFWDKFERTNYFLDAVIETADEPLNSRVVAFLLADPLGDGGQWDMFKAILKKYGAVPKEAMPETYSSSNTAELRTYLTSMLRFFTKQLRDEYKKSKDRSVLKNMKKDMLYKVYNILVKALGNPPEKVQFEYEDKDKKFHRMPEMTPQEFLAKTVKWNLDDRISIINAPTKDKPFNKTYTVKFLGNISEAKPVKYLNLEIDRLKEIAIESIKNGEPVWFGSDVGKSSERKLGIMDMDVYNYDLTLGYKPKWDKGSRLDYYESLLTHAMVLTGVNLDDEGKPVTWEVENSWGEKPGKKGMFSMGDEWFSNFVYQIMVDRKYLTEDESKAFEEEPKVLDPWDPMGALAL
ncbi:MAG: C1 family peptidase [Bacilli bacterium]